jgi:thioesterase domain-containing protein
MARLLEAEGGEVRLVLLVDPRAACREGERYYWSRARFHLRAGGFARAAVRKALAVGSRAERAVFQRGGSVPDAEATAPERFQLSFGEAIRRHRLRPYSGRLAVVQSDAGYPSARWLYQDIARGAFEWEVLAVDHATMFQSDSISLVGATLSEILARA